MNSKNTDNNNKLTRRHAQANHMGVQSFELAEHCDV